MANQRPAEQGVLEWWCRLTLRGLGIAFAIVGAVFFVFPNATIRIINATGALFGNYSNAPASELRFWLSLAIGYMVMVTALAFAAERDLRRNRSLLLFLALGKATSSLTCLGYYYYSINAFLYLANFAVDGSIAVIVTAIWLLVPMLGPPGAEAASLLTGETRPPATEPGAMAAMLEAMIPSDGPFSEGAGSFDLAPDIRRMAGRAAGGGGLRVAIGMLDVMPLVLAPWRGRFRRLPIEERVRLLEAWEQSRFLPLRQFVHTLKMLATVSFYSRPEIETRLGYPYPLIRVPRSEAPA